jgi:hypothetical protein
VPRKRLRVWTRETGLLSVRLQGPVSSGATAVVARGREGRRRKRPGSRLQRREEGKPQRGRTPGGYGVSSGRKQTAENTDFQRGKPSKSIAGRACSKPCNGMGGSDPGTGYGSLEGEGPEGGKLTSVVGAKQTRQAVRVAERPVRRRRRNATGGLWRSVASSAAKDPICCMR